ncbi:hypothetical protein PoB_005506300 [Plakobranchus ocellatus]|uniref:Uncharacterized protein n=1 Tax=Plakobranchus ocellatus TaxID=259542 RepID=A0AAV4CC53_9GAST|nr:hypothetical protein PoB_005506300 [Plakobranchus ocellatus]
MVEPQNDLLDVPHFVQKGIKRGSNILILMTCYRLMPNCSKASVSMSNISKNLIENYKSLGENGCLESVNVEKHNYFL